MSFFFFRKFQGNLWANVPMWIFAKEQNNVRPGTAQQLFEKLVLAGWILIRENAMHMKWIDQGTPSKSDFILRRENVFKSYFKQIAL